MNKKKPNKKELIEEISKLDKELASLREQLEWESMTQSTKGMAVALDDRSFRSNIEQVLTGALDAVVGANQSGRIIFWNKKAEEIFGWTLKEARGKSLAHTIIPAQYREAYERGWKQLLTPTEGEASNKRLSLTALRKSGEEFPVEMSVIPIQQGEMLLFSAFIEDVSEKQKVIDNLKEAKEASEKANKAKDEFIAQVSHEIRTPLNGIYGMLQLALDTELSEEQTDYLETAKKSAEVLTGIVDDVLDFSKIESGQLSLIYEPFDIHKSVADVVQLFSFNAKKKGLELSYNVSKDIPNILVGDWNRIRQIFLNLIGNSLKFTEKGEISLSVHLDKLDENDISLRCQVSDTGIGIPQSKKNSIFEAFIQADSSVSRNYGGTGLGLTIAHKLVELMDGWMWLESEEGKGSQFNFAIKLKTPSYTGELLKPRMSSLLKDLPILVVDDDSITRKALSTALDTWQISSKSVTSAPSAINELLNSHKKGKPYAIAIIDIGSDDLEGLELVAQIRNDQKFLAMPILLLSDSETSQKGLDVSAFDIIHVVNKPVNEAKLLLSLTETIERYPQLREQLFTYSKGVELKSSFNVLLAEDDKVNQKIVSLLLSRRGHTCKIVQNGQEVLEEISKQSYDAVIMDLQMPVLDGITTTKIIRAQEEESGNHLKIIASTAYATQDEKERFKEAGVDDYVSKPFSANELFGKLEELCHKQDTPVSVKSEKLLDKNFVVELFQNDQEMIKEAAQTYIKTLPEYKLKLRESIEKKEVAQLKKTAHQIRGATGNLGATKIAEKLEKLELSIKGKDQGEILSNKEQVIDMLDKLALELNEIADNE